jgi:hypothetical protein
MDLQALIEAHNPFASYEVSTERMGICEECPQMRVGLMCGVCHCALPAKVRMKASKCPKGEW